jgi:hypothetical protein
MGSGTADYSNVGGGGTPPMADLALGYYSRSSKPIYEQHDWDAAGFGYE